MSEGQLPCTLRSTFPLLPDEDFGKLGAGLTPHSSVIALTGSTEADSAFHHLAAWLLRHPLTCLGAALPGLWLIRDDLIRDVSIPGKIITALSRQSITVWGDMLEFGSALLCDLPGFREGNLEQFLAVTARLSAEACCRGTPPSRCPIVNVFEQKSLPLKTSLRVSEFHALVDWASNEAGAVTVSDLIEACQRTDRPKDIALVCESILGFPLVKLFPDVRRTESLEILIHDLCDVLDQRSRFIFLTRISLNSIRTLENLAGDIGVTRERVRQLQVNAEATVRKTLRSERFAPISWRAHTLAGLLGIAVPRASGYLEDSIQKVTQGVSDTNRDLVIDVLLWLAGPYIWDSGTGWLRCKELPERTIVNDCSDRHDRVNIDLVRQRLSKQGLVPQVHDAWINEFGKVKQVRDSWVVWTGSVADKAVRLLEAWGEPATPETLVNSIGEGHDVRGARSSLYGDERVMRVDMTRVGLRSWGMEEYSGIADEIDQELERRGGSAEVGDLVATLVERFGLTESSVKAYLGVPMFILEGHTVRRRTGLDPFPPIAPVTETAGCYLIEPETLAWRIDVNADTVRGSGRLMPASIAGWLGVPPGGQRILTADAGTVRITWPLSSSTGPCLGSIRFLAEKVAARPGDQILLLINRNGATIDASRVDPVAVGDTQGLSRLALLTGIPNGDSEAALLHRLGAALGVAGTRAAVSRELRQRGEGSLASLVPAENASPELDAAIDALRDLF